CMVFGSALARSAISTLLKTENDARSATGSAAKPVEVLRSAAAIKTGAEKRGLRVGLILVLIRNIIVPWRPVANRSASSQLGRYARPGNRAERIDQDVRERPRCRGSYFHDRSRDHLWISRGKWRGQDNH